MSGAVTSACLARDGHDVLGIDLDHTKLKLLNEGQPPIVEDGIEMARPSSLSPIDTDPTGEFTCQAH